MARDHVLSPYPSLSLAPVNVARESGKIYMSMTSARRAAAITHDGTTKCIKLRPTTRWQLIDIGGGKPARELRSKEHTKQSALPECTDQKGQQEGQNLSVLKNLVSATCILKCFITFFI